MTFSLKKFVSLLTLFVVVLLAGFQPEAQAAARPFALRYTNNTNGNIVQIGNTVMTCTVCTVINNTSTMANVDTDADTSTLNSSSANLTMPSGATVLFAGLYWGARSVSPSIGQVLFKTPSSFGYSSITASQLDTAVGGQANEYGGFADVTSQVNAGGSGTYWVGNVQTTVGTSQWGGWSLIVVYGHNSELLNNLSVFDGYQIVNNATGITVPVSGFLTPLSGPVISRVALIGWDGDNGAGGATYTGDSFQVNGTSIFDACNPSSNDFFNSSICNLGIPNETRNPNTATYPVGMTNTLGLDIDLVNLPSGIILNGATSASLKFTTAGEFFGAHAVAFATNLYVPNITSNVVKTVQDLNGGDLLTGDTLRYTISMSNTGQDTATDVILTDNIPTYTTYVPGSLRVVTGPNSSPSPIKTDGSLDDQAEYISTGAPRVVFRLGTGANATLGGSLPFYNPPPAQTSLTFDVTVNSGIPTGTLISNSASVSYKGQTIPANVYGTTSSAATAAVLTPPVLVKSFTPSTIDVNGVSQLKIVVNNPAGNAGTLNNVTFSDIYPANLVNTATPAPAITCTSGSTAGTLTGGTAGGNTLGMTPGATLLAGGSCTLTVNVTSATANNYTNTTGTPSASNGGTGSAVSAILSVGKPSISKAFATNPVLAGASSRLTLTLSNGLATSLTSVAFTDTYPVGLVNAAVPNVVSTCGGTVTATAGAGVISLTGGNLASATNCTVSVDVTSTTAGIYANTSGGISSTETGAAGNGSNTASLTVIGAPQAVKSFSPSSVGINVASQLSITISNPNTTAALTGVSFTDTYPALLLNTAAPNATLNCTAGSTATKTGGAASGSTIGISSGSLAAGGSCTVVVNVRSSTVGNYLNSTGAIASANGGTGTAATATLNVTNLVAPTITKVFAPATITLNGTSTLTITLTNPAPNAAAITGATFTDTYPFSVDNATVPNESTTCGGTVTVTPGGGSISLSGGTIPATGTRNCTVTVTVTSATAGSYANTIPAGGLTTGNAGVNAVAATATLRVLAPPTIAKSFTPASVAVNTNSLLTIILTNPNAVALTGVAFTDTYPALLLNNGAVTSNTCTAGGTAGTVTSVAGTNILNYTAGTIAANGSCTITRNVRSTTAGPYTNTTGTVSSTNGGTGLTASATLSVGQPAITKAFAPATVNTGGTSVLTITLSNPTAAAMTLAAFTDTYPAGILNASVPAASTTCALGSVTAASLGGSVALSGGTIPAAGSCTVTVSVTATATNTNTIPVGGLTVNGGASNATAANATLSVNPAPVATKSFSPASIAKNGISTLTISVQNANNAAMTGVAFTDTYPAGLVNTATPTPTATPASCTGTLTAAAASNSFALTGGSIPLNSTCNYTVQVTHPTEGSYLNNTGAVTSTNYGIGAAATATLNVIPNPPTATKAFSPATITQNATSSMTITLTNPNVIDITGAGFTDTYPAGLVNTNSPAVNTTCVGGTVSATSNGNSVQLFGATIPASGSCIVTVDVTSALAGGYTNNTGIISTGNAGNGASASGVLTVIGSPTVAKAFTAASITPGGSSVLTITLTNPNASTALAGLALIDTYPANVVNATVPAVSTTCGGTATAAAGGSTVTLSGGSLVAAASCTVTVTVTGSVVGTYANTIAAGDVTTTNAGANTVPASATLTVAYTPPTVAKAFSPTSVATNTNDTLTITLTNPNAVDITGVVFTDTYPTGLVNITGGVTGNTCGGTATALTTGAANTLDLTGGTIPANGSCTISYNQVQSATAGTYINTIAAGGVTTTNAGTNTAAASATLTVLSPFTVTKVFQVNPVATNTNSRITITLTNPNAVAITGVSFSDLYPGALVNVAGGALSTTCAPGVAAFTTGIGTSTLSLTNGTIPANGSCRVRYTFAQSATAGAYTNTLAAGSVTSTNGGSNTVEASAELLVGSVLDISKSFTASTIALGSNSTLTITIFNATGAARTTAAFTDTYPAGVVNATPLVTGGTCVGTRTAVAGGNSIAFAGGVNSIANNTSCTVTVSVTGIIAGANTNTIPIGGLTASGPVSNPAAASATLTVTATPPAVAKTFSPATIAPNATSVLTVTLTNANAVDITGAAFTDTYPVGLVNTSTANSATTCGGTATAANNGNTLQLTGGSIPAGGNCTITVNVTSASSGSYVNTLAIADVTSANAGSNTVAGSATLTVNSPLPSLMFLKTLAIISDPINGSTNPKFIPGAVVQYTLSVINSGTGSVDNNTTLITDPVPANTALFVNDIGGTPAGPISFTQGAASSTLTYVPADVSYSNDNGTTWTYVPVAGTDGCDPLVTNLRLNPKGTFVGNPTPPSPSFDLNFRMCVK